VKLKSLLLILLGLLSIPTARAADSVYGRIPLRFEANIGQTDKRVKFISRGSGYGLFLTSDEAILRLTNPRPATVRMKLVGANARPRTEGLESLPGVTHYLKGTDPRSWHGDVPSYARVRYESVYPGIDLVYYGNQRQLEYDFTVAPGSRPNRIQFHIDGVHDIQIAPDGRLVLKTGSGEIVQKRPTIYQETTKGRVAVAGGYVLRGKGMVGFDVGAYDTTKPLIIDPTLVYSSYFGGSGTADQANAIAVDEAGNAYITGQTTSANLAVSIGVRGTLGGQMDGFVLKLDPAGTTVLYSTYFGGAASDEGHSIAVDAGGNAYVGGYTFSADFPVVNGFQKVRGGQQDAFLFKLNSAGNAFVYSTYLGGTQDERALAVAVDSDGNAVVTGTTASNNFPIVNPLQRTHAGGLGDVFVTKLGTAGNVVYSTYVGGIGHDQAYGVALDGIGNAYVAGYTTSTNFPRVNAFQSSYAGGSDDAFVFKINSAGTALEYSTYLGGASSENAVRVAVDSSGSAYITGYTVSPNFPTLNAYQSLPTGGFDTFITRMAPDGQSLLFSTYFGGSATESGTGIALDNTGNIYVAGYSESYDLPVANSLQLRLAGTRNAYLARFRADGLDLAYSTFLGGAGVDAAVGLSLDGAGNAYLVGLANSTNFPVANAVQSESGGGQDAFVAKINASDVVTSSAFQIAQQGGASFETRGARDASLFGFATVEPDRPTGQLTGLEIIDYRQSLTTVTEAAVPAAPLSEVGRIFIEASSARSIISIANAADEEASVDLFFTEATGETTHFVTIKVPAHGHFSRYVTDDPILIPSDKNGTLNYTSSIPVSVAAFRASNSQAGTFVISTTPIGKPLAVSNQPVVIPNFAEGAGWSNRVILVNTTENAESGEVHFVSPGSATEPGMPVEVALGTGDTSASVIGYDIPPRSYQQIQTAGISTRSEIPFAMSSGFSFKTPGSTANQASGYAVAEPATPDSQVNGIQLIESRTSGVVQNQAGIVASPLRQSGRVYMELSAQVRSLLSIANPNDEDATVSFSFLDESGGAPIGTITFIVPARGQFSNFITESPLSVPSPSTGTLSFSSSVPIGVTALRFFTNTSETSLVSAVAVGDTTNFTTEPLMIPQFAEGAGWNTQILLVNTTDEQISGEVRFISPNGTPVEVALGDGSSSASTVAYDIPSRGFRQIATAAAGDVVQTGWIEVVPSDGTNTPHGQAILNLRNGITIISQSSIEGQRPATTLKFYSELFGNFGAAKTRSIDTALAVANRASVPVTVRLTMTRLDGSTAGSGSIQVPANGQSAMFVDQIPGFEAVKAPFQGFLRLTTTSSTGVAAVTLRSMFNEIGNFLTTQTGPLKPDAGASRVIFPYLTDGNGFSSQFIVTNESAAGTVYGILRFNAQDGTPLQIDELRIGSVYVLPNEGTDTPHAHGILTLSSSGSTVFETSIEAQQPVRLARLYGEMLGDFEAGEAGSSRTAIAIANPSAQPATVRLEVTSLNGTLLGTSRPVSVPPNGQVAVFLQQVPGLEGLPPFQGVVRVTALTGGGITAAAVRAKFNERGTALMTTTGPLIENAGGNGQMVFPHIAEGGGFTTQFVVVGGASDQPNSGVLRFFSQTGQPLSLTLSH
jgi:hypothetical protein